MKYKVTLNNRVYEVEVEEGEAMLVEFNGAGKLTPTLPLVDPLQPSYFAWYLEEIMLKPAYMTVLRGRA